jgi:hypothetical protein
MTEVEPETRHAWQWRTYEPKPWPSVPEPNRLVRWFDAYCDWMAAVSFRTLCAWALIAFTIGAAGFYLLTGGRIG